MKHWELLIIFSVLFVWAVFRFIKFRKDRKIKTFQEVKIIEATGPPKIVPLSQLNRAQRRRLLKHEGKKKTTVLNNKRNEIIEASEFLKKHNIQDKFFDGK